MFQKPDNVTERGDAPRVSMACLRTINSMTRVERGRGEGGNSWFLIYKFYMSEQDSKVEKYSKTSKLMKGKLELMEIRPSQQI